MPCSRDSASLTSPFAVSMRIRPPAGMASRAFRIRFRITCSICPGSATTWCRFGLEHRLQIDVLADHQPQHALQVRYDRVQVERARLHRLPAREPEQLRRQPRAAIGGLANLIEFRTQRVFLADPIQQNVAVPGDQRQQVREVVGHAADQPSHRFHFFGLLLLASGRRWQPAHDPSKIAPTPADETAIRRRARLRSAVVLCKPRIGAAGHPLDPAKQHVREASGPQHSAAVVPTVELGCAARHSAFVARIEAVRRPPPRPRTGSASRGTPPRPERSVAFGHFNCAFDMAAIPRCLPRPANEQSTGQHSEAQR